VTDQDFIYKRAALYKLLGIPLPILRDKDILELGPGGGYNAVAVAHYKPRSYVFVDATNASLEELNRKKSAGLYGQTKIEIIESNIFDFTDSRTFDLVVIEGVIPGQTKPKEMLRHAASFVSENGFLVITTATSTSLMSELCRRLFRPFITTRHNSFNEQTNAAVRIFEPHLRSLGTKTRPAIDWVLDVILHEWPKNYSFSLLDSISTIGGEFVFYGSSPKFLIDDRFYKKIDRSAKSTNELAYEQFSALSLAMLDYRVPILKTIDFSQSKLLDDLSASLEKIVEEILESNSYDRLDDFLFHLKLLREILPEESQQTIISITDFIENFPRLIETNIQPQFDEFSKWWGRGQQYVSFIRTF
jgi:SAM-dependent methyltransferase